MYMNKNVQIFMSFWSGQWIWVKFDMCMYECIEVTHVETNS